MLLSIWPQKSVVLIQSPAFARYFWQVKAPCLKHTKENTSQIKPQEGGQILAIKWSNKENYMRWTKDHTVKDSVEWIFFFFLNVKIYKAGWVMLSHQQSRLHIIPAARHTVESPLPSRSSELLTSWGLLGTAPCRWDAPEPRMKREHSPGAVRPCSQFAVWWGKHCWLQCLRVPNARAVVNQGRESKGQGGNWEWFKAQNGKWDAVEEKTLSTSRPGHGHSLPVTEHWDKQDRVNTDSEKTQE